MSIFDLFAQISHQCGNIEYLVVGLGNPGSKYKKTRHNAGFCAMDAVLAANRLELRQKKFQAEVADGTVAGKRCLFMKPQTFMNLSGEAVGEAARFYKIPPERIIVLFDDISLPPGKLRIRRKGSAGGHNGIKSIIEHLGSDNFPRVKLGVGAKPRPDYNLADWVLSAFSPEQQKQMEQVYETCPEIISLLVEDKIDEAMNRFSR
ncbi:MAG: aminoacyl-tRNA hydrolase [Clostridiales bacterium]|nr:MAG: aminoacyl-tRNA hydrolase [Clostridiales bacterium]